jgi:hypothetical protein
VASLTTGCPVVDAPIRRTGTAVCTQHGGSCRLDGPPPESTAAAVARAALPANEHMRLAGPPINLNLQASASWNVISRSRPAQLQLLKCGVTRSAGVPHFDHISHSMPRVDMLSHLQDAVHEAAVAQVVEATQALWQAVGGIGWHS